MRWFFVVFYFLSWLSPNSLQGQRDSLLAVLRTEESASDKIKALKAYVTEADDLNIDDYTRLSLLVSDAGANTIAADEAVVLCARALLNKGKTEQLEKWVLALSEPNSVLPKSVYPRVVYELARFYSNKGEYKKTKGLLSEIQKFSKENGVYNELINAYVEKGIVSRRQGDLDQAMRYLDSCKLYISDTTSYVQLSKYYVGKGRVFHQKSEYDSSSHYYLLAEKLSLENDAKRQLVTIWNNLGNVAQVQGKYDEALKYYLKSIKLKEEQGNLRGMSIGYHNVGAIKYDMEDFEGAIEQFHKSNRIAKKIDFGILNIHNLLKLGYCYFDQIKLDSASYYFTKAKMVSEEMNFFDGKVESNLHLGLCEMKLQNFDQAVHYLNIASPLVEAMDSKLQKVNVYTAWAQLYMAMEEEGKLGDLQIGEIENKLLEAHSLVGEIDFLDKKILVLEALAKFSKRQSRPQQQAMYQQKLIELKDSMYRASRLETIAEMEAKYATVEKEKEILKLEAQQELGDTKLRYWQYSLAVLTVMFGLFAFLIFKFMQSRGARQKLEYAESFRSKLANNLHDEVGTLLTGLAMQSELASQTADKNMAEKMAKISELGRKAMDQMRDTVWAMDGKNDSVEKLADRMKDYLLDVGAHDKFSVSHDLDSGATSRLAPDVRQQLYLIFKEAVSNSMKHSTGDSLRVRLTVGDEIVLTVADNGTASKPSSTSGLGLKSMEQRAASVNGQLHISDNDGYIITARIPLA